MKSPADLSLAKRDAARTSFFKDLCFHRNHRLAEDTLVSRSPERLRYHGYDIHVSAIRGAEGAILSCQVSCIAFQIRAKADPTRNPTPAVTIRRIAALAISNGSIT